MSAERDTHIQQLEAEIHLQAGEKAKLRAFVQMIARLEHSNDESWRPGALCGDDYLDAMDGLIAQARDLYAASPHHAPTGAPDDQLPSIEPKSDGLSPSDEGGS